MLSNPDLIATTILTGMTIDSPFLDPRTLNTTPEGLAWMERRQEVLARDEGRCVMCGTNRSLLEAHHIVARRHGGTDELDNLVTLCRTYHAKTDTYGRPKRDEKISGKPDEAKVSRPV